MEYPPPLVLAPQRQLQARDLALVACLLGSLAAGVVVTAGQAAIALGLVGLAILAAVVVFAGTRMAPLL